MGKIYREYGIEISVILALAGIQFSLIINEIVRNSSIDLTNILFVLSILILVDYKSLLRGRIYKQGRAMSATLLYNVYALAFAISAGYGIWTSATGIIYTLYVIVLIFAFMTNRRPLKGEFLVNATWLSTGIFSALLCYLVTNGFTVFGQGIMTLSGGADRLSLSAVAFYHLCSALLYKPQKRVSLLVKIAFVVFAFYDIMACSRRGMMVAMAFIVLYHLWQNTEKQVKISSLKRAAAGISIVLLVTVILYHVFLRASDFLQSYIDRMLSGIATYFGSNAYGTDAAAVSRNIALNSFMDEFLSGSFTQILFGHGYAYWWHDIPYLEAFMDLGLVGGVWYLYMQLIYPIKALAYKTKDLSLRFAQYFGILTITYNLYSGVPYGNYKFVGLILLIYTANKHVKYNTSHEAQFPDSRYAD